MSQSVGSTVAHLRAEVAKAVVGQDDVIEQVLIALLTEGHALIEGVPGTAKTLMVKVLARAIGAEFGRIQFTPDLMPADVTGTNIFNMATSTFSFATDRSSRTCCWLTKSIARLQRLKPRCSRRWKSAR